MYSNSFYTGVEPWRGCSKGLKIEFWHYQVQEAVWCKLFVNLVYTLTLLIHLSTQLRD